MLGLVVGPGAAFAGLRLRGSTLASLAVESLSAADDLDVVVVSDERTGATAMRADQPWRARAGAGLVLHDARCPLLPAAAIRECLRRGADGGPGTAVIGVRPVTDTLKEVVGGAVVDTVDRNTLAALASPVVVGQDLLDGLSSRFPLAGDLADLPGLVHALTGIGIVVPVEVSSSAWRVSDREDLELLECLHGLHQILRER